MKTPSISKFIKRSKKAGLPPGTLVHVGEQREAKVRISVIDYDEKTIEERVVENVEDVFSLRDTKTVSWINIDGVHDTDLIQALGDHFGLHPLILEDITSTGQRPKLEDYDDYLYVVVRMLAYDRERNDLSSEQVSVVLAPRAVISFQERPGDVFDMVRKRIRDGKRIRKLGTDYLAYVLLDSVVDSYFAVLEAVGDHIESLEEELVTDPTQETLARIHALKREMLYLRKSVWPLREVVSGLDRGESPLIKKTTHVYLRDVYDHTIQVIDTIETYRDMVSGMLDTYLSSISNRMNEVMKVLTIIATIFIPLTFIAGVYGMNFNPEASPYNMPELAWYWGYPAVWLVMAVVAVLMLAYFKNKKWL